MISAPIPSSKLFPPLFEGRAVEALSEHFCFVLFFLVFFFFFAPPPPHKKTPQPNPPQPSFVKGMTASLCLFEFPSFSGEGTPFQPNRETPPRTPSFRIGGREPFAPSSSMAEKLISSLVLFLSLPRGFVDLLPRKQGRPHLQQSHFFHWSMCQKSRLPPIFHRCSFMEPFRLFKLLRRSREEKGRRPFNLFSTLEDIDSPVDQEVLFYVLPVHRQLNASR